MAQIVALIIKLSASSQLDVSTVLAVAQVESNFNIKAQSPGGDLGLFQLNPKAFPKYTKKQLLNPETNVRLGIAHLAEMKKSCPFRSESDFVVCFNVGAFGATKIKHPKLWPYRIKVDKMIRSLK